MMFVDQDTSVFIGYRPTVSLSLADLIHHNRIHTSYKFQSRLPERTFAPFILPLSPFQTDYPHYRMLLVYQTSFTLPHFAGYNAKL